MNENSMTALVSCFARAYHYKNNKCRIYSDPYSSKILTIEEYNTISDNMIKGITYFNPNFKGTNEQALKWIVNNQLSPSVLGRSIFCENSLLNSIKIGCRQYLIYASGYDTSIYKLNKKLKNILSFEIDTKTMIENKKKRLLKNNIDISSINFIECNFKDNNWNQYIINSNYNKKTISFNSLLGISYYLTKKEFIQMIKNISDIVCMGSSIIFDYQTFDKSINNEKNEELAKEAKETMKSKYSYYEIENILSNEGFLIYEHLNNIEMTNTYFSTYNLFNNDNKMRAPNGINYCLAIKK